MSAEIDNPSEHVTSSLKSLITLFRDFALYWSIPSKEISTPSNPISEIIFKIGLISSVHLAIHNPA